MFRKILFFFWAIFLFIPTFSNKAQAAVTCNGGLTGINFTYDFTLPLKQDKTSINVTINHNSGLPDGTYGIKVSDSSDRTQRGWTGRLYDTGVVTSGSDMIFNNVTTTGDSFDKGTARITLYGLTISGSAQTRNDLCYDEFNVEDVEGGGGDTCDIVFNTDFKPNSGISFYVTGLSGDDVDKRGMVLTRTDDRGRPLVNDLSNICDTNKRLKDPGGVGFPNSNQNRWPASYYTVKVTEGCEGFPLDSAKGNNICHSPILIKVDPNDGRVIGPVFGLSCVGGAVGDRQCQSLGVGHEEDLCLPDQNTGFLRCHTPEEFQGRSPYNPCNPDGEGNPPYSCQTAIGEISTSPGGFIKSVLVLILSLSGGIIILLIIVNGYKLMVSQGDPEKVKEARESVMSAIAGLLLIIFSIVILQFITVDVLHLPGFE